MKPNCFWESCIQGFPTCKEVLPSVLGAFSADEKSFLEISSAINNMENGFLAQVH